METGSGYDHHGIFAVLRCAELKLSARKLFFFPVHKHSCNAFRGTGRKRYAHGIACKRFVLFNVQSDRIDHVDRERIFVSYPIDFHDRGIISVVDRAEEEAVDNVYFYAVRKSQTEFRHATLAPFGEDGLETERNHAAVLYCVALELYIEHGLHNER